MFGQRHPCWLKLHLKQRQRVFLHLERFETDIVRSHRDGNLVNSGQWNGCDLQFTLEHAGPQRRPGPPTNDIALGITNGDLGTWLPRRRSQLVVQHYRTQLHRVARLIDGRADTAEHQRHVPVVLGFLLLVLPFLPATNLVVTVGFVVAERVLYIPSMGCLILVVYGAQRLWERSERLRKPILLLTIVLLAAGCLKTIVRNQDWSSREALLRSGLKTLPHNAKMHYNFGNFLRDSAQPEPAIAHYREALRLWPTYASAHNNIGTLMPQFATAEYHFREAIKYASEHINAHYNLGQLYRKSNRTVEAIRMLERCIQLEPLYTAAYLELVKLYADQPAAAGRLLARVVHLNPYNADLRRQYGDWLVEQNLLVEAIKQYQEGIKIMETHQLSVIGACRCLRKMGQQSRLHQMVLSRQFGSSSVRVPSRRWAPVSVHFCGAEAAHGVFLLQQKGFTGTLRDGWEWKNGETRNPVPFNGFRIRTPYAGRALPGEAFQTGAGTRRSDDTKRSTTAKGAVPRVGNAAERPRATPSTEETEISIRILRTPHCNRSEHLPSTLKACKLANASTPSASASTAATSPTAEASHTGKPAGGKSKKWSKTRHKPKRQQSGTTLDPNGALAPLLVSNLLDKL
uniref:Uncharacterized protein n=1 Tax=Anopheles farauti TaxID=69004 RepID=A0A182QU00_9DIPT